MNDKLIWKDEYSVGVKEIDEQHKMIFSIINNLIETINTTPSDESISAIIKQIQEYKACHFCTEEAYFEKFSFTGAPKHIEAHKCFSIEILRIQQQHKDSKIALAFALVDFMEDWLIKHLLSMDQEYKQCFKENGLR